MYKVVLVDDETIDLDGMLKLVKWAELNMEITAAFNNVTDALHFLQITFVDILVTDISMPGMSGLELCQKIKVINPALKFVFVSGHADFQYAKKALQINAAAYVLKPIDDEELHQVLLSISSELDLKRDKQSLKAEFNKSIPYFKNEILRQFLEGEQEFNNLNTLESYFNFNKFKSSFKIAIIEIDNLSHIIDDQHKETISDLPEVLTMIKKKLGEEMLTIYCTFEAHKIAVVLTGLKLEDFVILNSLIQFIKINSLRSITISLSNTVLIVEELPYAYRQAREILSYKMFLGKGKLLTSSCIERSVIQNIPIEENSIQKFITFLSENDRYELGICIDELFSKAVTLNDKISFYSFVLDLLFAINKDLKLLGENIYSVLGGEFKYLDILMKFETIHEIKDWLVKGIFQVSEHLNLKKQTRNRNLIKEVEKYVCNRLSEKIVVSDVAKYFAFSSNYLGFLFKEETRENFSDFIIRKRMEKAKELLKDKKLKIYEVADSVGYKNLTYFSRQFKEHFGISPGYFRSQL